MPSRSASSPGRGVLISWCDGIRRARPDRAAVGSLGGLPGVGLRRCRRAPSGIAVALLLCVLPAIAESQSITATGSVTQPAGPGDTTLAGALLVGLDGGGTLTVEGGGVLSIGSSLAIGGSTTLQSTGQGTVTVRDSGSTIWTTGQGSFVNVGQWGAASTGLLSILDGGALITTFFSLGLGDVNTAQDSTGTVLVDGPGSSITLNGFSAGGAAAGGTIGRDGGVGTLTLRNGATLGISAPGATSGGPGFTLGRDGGTGTLNIESGAMLSLDGTGVTGGTGPGFTVGSSGTGALTVTGASLNLAANRFGGGMTIGTAGGTGTVTLENGADVLMTGSPDGSSPNLGFGFNLGRSTVTSQGTLNVSGGATLTLNSTTSGGGFTIGDLGIGTVTVSGAGTTVLQDGLTASATPGITIGAQAGSTGTLTIQDGALWTINRSNAGCCLTVGRLGHGVLRILNGGHLILNDTSSVGAGSGIRFGGDGGTLTGGTFDALISGPGSALSINSAVDGGMLIGWRNGSSGTVTVSDGATVSTDAFAVGLNAGSAATLNVAGAGTAINLVGDVPGVQGAGISVGASGVGTMNVSGGAQVTVDSGTRGAGLTVGGSRTATAGGTGTLDVSGADSKISLIGATITFSVGYDITGGSTPTTGTATVSGGAQVLLDVNGRGSVGSTVGSTGSVTVTGGGSLLDSGAFLGIGKDRDGNPGGTGSLTLSDGGTVKATTINCGAGGAINGNGGTLVGDVIADPDCVIAPGASPGTLSIVGSFTNLGARIVLEVDASGNHDVLAIEGPALFDAATQIEVRVDPAFQPPAGTVTLQLIQTQADAHSQTEPLLTLVVPESGAVTVEVSPSLPVLESPPVVVPVPVPAGAGVVQIDIKPGSAPNVINLGSAGAIPVAILSSPAFDALTVDPATVTLDGAAVKLVGKTQRPLCNAEDVSGDGRIDLVCHIVTSQLPAEGHGIATLRARTFPTISSPGMEIQGSDFVRIVP